MYCSVDYEYQLNKNQYWNSIKDDLYIVDGVGNDKVEVFSNYFV